MTFVLPTPVDVLSYSLDVCLERITRLKTKNSAHLNAIMDETRHSLVEMSSFIPNHPMLLLSNQQKLLFSYLSRIVCFDEWHGPSLRILSFNQSPGSAEIRAKTPNSAQFPYGVSLRVSWNDSLKLPTRLSIGSACFRAFSDNSLFPAPTAGLDILLSPQVPIAVRDQLDVLLPESANPDLRVDIYGTERIRIERRSLVFAIPVVHQYHRVGESNTEHSKQTLHVYARNRGRS